MVSAIGELFACGSKSSPSVKAGETSRPPVTAPALQERAIVSLLAFSQPIVATLGLPLGHHLLTLERLTEGIEIFGRHEKARSKRAKSLISLKKIGCGDRI